MNSVCLTGRLTRDPELSYSQKNTAICKFGMAFKNGFGDESAFADCVMFGKRAETIQKYFNKGKQISVSGKLQFSRWTGQDGQNRSKLEVLVDDWWFVEEGRGKQQDRGNGQPTSPLPQTEDEIPF